METSDAAQKAMKMEGMLKKKSPGAFSRYQKRYFVVQDNGKYLSYYKSKPKGNKQQKPKGIIKIYKIKQIEELGERDFIIEYEGRNFNLRADNSGTKEIWIRNLEILRIRVTPIASPQSASPDKKAWKFEAQSDEVVENLTRSHTENEATKRPQSAMTLDIRDINDHVLLIKGIYNYLDKIPREILRNHMVCGFMNKRSKGKVKYWRKRWCVLISSSSINDHEGVDEESIPENILPPWMLHDNLYYFRYKAPDDTSENRGVIPIKNCRLKAKDMTQSKDSGATFKVDTGHRVFHFNCDSEDERDRWMMCLNNAMQNQQDLARSITGRPKFVRKLIKLYDTEGEVAVKTRIKDEFYQELKAEIIPDLIQLLDHCNKLEDNLTTTIDGCVSSEPQRIDIAETYGRYFHKKLCKVLQDFWDLKGKDLEQNQLIDLIDWVTNYNQNLEKLGIKDSRVKAGIILLSKTVSFRMLAVLVPTAVEILRGSVEFRIYEHEIRKLICQAIATFENQSNPILIYSVMKIITELLIQFQYAVGDMLDRGVKFNLDFIIALCNDSLFFADNLEQWLTTQSDDVNIKELRNIFLDMGKQTAALLADCQLQQIEIAFTKQFMDINFEDVFEKFTKSQDNIDKTINKKYLKDIWEDELNRICVLYTQTVISNKDSIKYESMLIITETIKSDALMLSRYFSDKIDESSVQPKIQGLIDFVYFLEALPREIPDACHRMRETYKQDFDYSVAEVLIGLRSDLEKNEKLEAMANARGALNDGYNYDEYDMEESTIFSDLCNGPLDIEPVVTRQVSTPIEHMDIDPALLGAPDELEGYLYYKKANKLGRWKARYFVLRNDTIYAYKTQRAHKAAKHIPLNKADNALQYKEKKFKINITGKTYNFKTGNEDDTYLWVSAVQKSMFNVQKKARKNISSVFSDTSDDSLFQDIDGIMKHQQIDRLQLTKIHAQYLPEPPKKQKEDTKNTNKRNSTTKRDSYQAPTNFRANSYTEESTGCCGCFK